MTLLAIVQMTRGRLPLRDWTVTSVLSPKNTLPRLTFSVLLEFFGRIKAVIFL